MEDCAIVELYWQRREEALEESQKKYGGLCRSVARGILGSPEDAQECVSDTWLEAWNSMPQQCPACLRPWLGRALRRNAIDRWRAEHRQKRFGGMETLVLELEDCVPAPSDPQRELEAEELAGLVARWLEGLRREERRLFLRRYWNGEALKDLAAEERLSPAVLAQRMRRLRGKLKSYLEKEGVIL